MSTPPRNTDSAHDTVLDAIDTKDKAGAPMDFGGDDIKASATDAFITKDNLPVRSISLEQQQRLFSQLTSEFGISQLQMVEAGAFSLAMVVRFALGLSAEGGASIGVINDSLAGAIAVAGIRHLTNSGAQSAIFIVSDTVSSDTVITCAATITCTANTESDVNGSVAANTSRDATSSDALQSLSPLLRQQLIPLIRSGLDVYFLSPTLPPHPLHELLPLAHNVIVGFGASDPIQPIDTSKMGFLIEALNDAMAPIHCIDYPPGLDPVTGKANSNTVFASSTLSLGLPLSGLIQAADYVGRHYLCDISLPPLLLAEQGLEIPFIFSDQPVKQIFPVAARGIESKHQRSDASDSTSYNSTSRSALEALEGLAEEAQRTIAEEKANNNS